MTDEQKRALAIATAKAKALKAKGSDGIDYENLYSPQNAQYMQGSEQGAGANVLDPIQGDPTAVSTVLDNVVGGYLPGMSTGEKIGTALNMAGESMTGGIVGDEASAAVESLIPGVDYASRRDHYQQQEAQLEKENPMIALAADIGGAMVMPGGAALGGLAKGANLASSMARSAGIGGALGGMYGFMEGEGGFQERVNSAKGTALPSAIISSLIPMGGAAARKVADKFAFERGIKRAAKGLPDIDEARKLARQAYDDLEKLGVEIKAEKFEDMRKGILARLLDDSAYSKRPGGTRRVPMTASVLEDMAAASDEMLAQKSANPSLPFREFEGFRQDPRAATGNFNLPTDQRAGRIVKDVIDETISTLQPSDVTRGDAKVLSEVITKARKLHHQVSKAGDIEDAIEAANAYAAGFSRGIKNQFRNILRNKKRRSGFNEAERRLMQRIVDGSISERFLDAVGSGLTQVGGVIGAGFGIAGANPAAALGGAALYGASRGARAGASKLAEKNASLIERLIASGRASDIPTQAQISGKPMSLIEQLLRQGTAASLQ